MRLQLAGAAALLVACTLVNQESPNTPPSLTRTRIDTLHARRGGKVRLEVTAADQDYDPLFFDWQAYRLSDRILAAIDTLTSSGLMNQPEQLRSLYGFLKVGEPVDGFADSSAQAVNTWFAPQSIEADSVTFLLVVTVRDRDCGVISDTAEHASCIEDESQSAQVFFVNVTQRPPSLRVSADTVEVHSDSTFVLEARVDDPDHDPLQVDWSLSVSPEDGHCPNATAPVYTVKTDEERGLSRLEGTVYCPGEYTFAVTASDGADSVSAQIHVRASQKPGSP